MSKEITVFVFDLTCDLAPGLSYFHDVVIAKILKARKTDFISIIACYSPITAHAYADDGMFKHVEVVCHKEVPTYKKLQQWTKKLAPAADIKPDAADCFDAFMIGAGLLNETLKLKFLRNIVVFTDGHALMSSWNTDLATASAGAINSLDINVIVGVPKLHQENENIAQWRKKLQEFRRGHLSDALVLANSTNYTPPLKRVRPIRAAKDILQLRLGADVAQLATSDSYDPSSDTCLCLEVEVYPAVKTEKPIAAHQYLVGASVSQIKTETSYYIRGEGEENVPIVKGDWVDGFKYSNFDLIAVDESLRGLATLKTDTGLDILGFIHREKVPMAYFTSESFYVVPTSEAQGNAIGVAAFCKALIELDSFAITRYVQKPNDEVQMCLLMPVKILHNKKHIYAFAMTRLPFKEDEKMGRFPKLTNFTTTSGRKIDQPEDLDMKMEEFIRSKDLDAVLGSSDPHTISNRKVTMREPSSLPVELPVQPTLTPSSPAIQKYNQNLKKIIAKSLGHASLLEFLQQDKFVENVMSGNETNLFNLGNILSVNGESKWLVDVNKKSNEASHKLVESLDIEYTSKKFLDQEKQKKKWHAGPNSRFGHGTYGAHEGPYEEELELDQLLE